MRHPPTVHRRAFLQTAAGGLAACLVGTPALARQHIAITPVDELTLQIVVDAATFGPFLPDQRLPGLRVERIRGEAGPRMSRRSLMAEFGLSILARSRRGQETRHVMVDLGRTPEVLANNMSLLGVDPAQLDAAVLSHGHLDHYGGAAGLFGRVAPQRGSVPLIVGGEEIFCERVAMVGNPPPVMGLLDRDELARAGLVTRIAADPILLAGHGFTTGVIPLRSFERAAIPTQMRPGVGCDAATLPEGKRNLAQVPDDAEHELATCFAVRDLGLVVIASCSHRGVLNSIRRAQAVSGIDRVHAVAGGFHLVRPRTEDEARRTVAELAEIAPAYVVPMHCTGEVFIAEALRRMPDKVIRPYVGDRFTFGTA